MNLPALMATHQLRQREYLLRITRAMTSRLDLPSLLRLILTSAAEMVGCRAGLIALWEDGAGVAAPGRGQRFQVRAVYGIPPELLPAFHPLLDNISFVQEWGSDNFDGDRFDRDPDAGVLTPEEATILMPEEAAQSGEGSTAGPEAPGGNGDRRREWQIPVCRAGCWRWSASWGASWARWWGCCCSSRTNSWG